MESEEDSKLPFWIADRREREMVCLLPLCTCRKPTYTDRYLHFKSHRPNHLKKGIVRCLYQRARRVTNMSENLKKERETPIQSTSK